MWGEVKATFRTRSRVGKQSKSITVSTNDPDKKTMTLVIKGEIYKLLWTSPGSLSFGKVYRGKSKTLTFKVIPWGDTEFEIERIEVPTDDFEAHVVKSSGLATVWRLALRSTKDGLVKKFGSKREDEAGPENNPDIRPEEARGDTLRAVTVAVTVRPTASIGRRSGKVKIHTNLEEMRVLQVLAFVDVVGHISVDPPAHNFGVIRTGEKKKVTLAITSNDKTTFKITRVENGCEQVSVSLTEVQPGARYELTVETKPDAPVGRLRGTVKLYTDDPNQPEMKVKLYGKVQN